MRRVQFLPSEIWVPDISLFNKWVHQTLLINIILSDPCALLLTNRANCIPQQYLPNFRVLRYSKQKVFQESWRDALIDSGSEKPGKNPTTPTEIKPITSQLLYHWALAGSKYRMIECTSSHENWTCFQCRQFLFISAVTRASLWQEAEQNLSLRYRSTMRVTVYGADQLLLKQIVIWW